MTPDERDRLVRLEAQLAQLRSSDAEIKSMVVDIKSVTDKMKSDQLYVRAGLAIIVVTAGAVTWILNTVSSVGGLMK